MILHKRNRSLLSSIDRKNGILNIEEGSLLEILDKFKKQSNFGEHNILIYPDRYALREIYSRACKIALKITRQSLCFYTMKLEMKF